jgi:hypothetical protein
MADPTRDIRAASFSHLTEKSPRDFTEVVRVDFSANNSGAGESNDFYQSPPGCISDSIRPIVVTAEGGTLTVDIGPEANPDGFVDGADGNATAGTMPALAGTEAYLAATAAGLYCATATKIRITTVDAADAAVLDIVVRGTLI